MMMLTSTPGETAMSGHHNKLYMYLTLITLLGDAKSFANKGCYTYDTLNRVAEVLD